MVRRIVSGATPPSVMALLNPQQKVAATYSAKLWHSQAHGKVAAEKLSSKMFLCGKEKR